MSRRVWAAYWGAVACVLVACSGGGDQLPHGGTDQTGPIVHPDAAAPNQTEGGSSASCTPAETQDCVIDRGTFMGIHDCAKGTQTCADDGQWGDCFEL